MQDPDLVILNDCNQEQLKSLVDILVFDKDGNKRISESLSGKKEFMESYPNELHQLIPAITDEIQRYGGNTILNIVRGHGVQYREILEDVCDKLKVNYNKKLSTELLEGELLRKVAVTVVEKMTEEDVKQFDAQLDKKRLQEAVFNNKGAAVLAIMSVIVAQMTKQAGTKALVLFGRILAPRLVSMVVPGLNVLAALWTVADIASPAYRVTVPFTITLAFIRRQTSIIGEDLKALFA